MRDNIEHGGDDLVQKLSIVVDADDGRHFDLAWSVVVSEPATAREGQHDNIISTARTEQKQKKEQKTEQKWGATEPTEKEQNEKRHTTYNGTKRN